MAAEPPIPMELLRVIFELAARSDKHSRRKLMLISWDVCRWIEPIVYEALTFSGHSVDEAPRLSAFMRTLKHGRKPVHFYHTSIKSILLLDRITPPDIKSLIESCQDLRRFGYWSSTTLDEEITTMLAALPLERLSLPSTGELDRFLSATMKTRSPAARTLTHLDLTFTGVPEPALLAHLDRLTHIMADILASEVHVQLGRIVTLLQEHKSLQVVAVQTYAPEKLRRHLRTLQVEDLRLVLMRPVDIPSDDWNAHWDGNLDLWDVAEDVVQDRMAVQA